MSSYILLDQNFGQLLTNTDARGDLTELYRDAWPDAPTLKQWNLVHNKSNVMRGMHVHFMHSDFLIVIGGEMHLGLCDIRPDSAQFGERTIVTLNGDKLNWIHIRPGILHGFYIPHACTIIYGLSQSWDMNDEFGCQWNDPELALNWPDISDPILSSRDASYGSFAQLLDQYKEFDVDAQ